MISKWLTTSPSSVDTSLAPEAIRWNSKTPAAVVSPLSMSIEVPSINVFPPRYTQNHFLAAQTNYTAPAEFVITSWRDFYNHPSQDVYFAIRYRVGDVVTRYFFYPFIAIEMLPSDRPVVQIYNGQLIKPQFCIEYWYQSRFPSRIYTNAWHLKTSLQVIPSNIFDAPFNLTGNTYDFNSLGVNLPFNLPQQFPAAGPWNSN